MLHEYSCRQSFNKAKMWAWESFQTYCQVLLKPRTSIINTIFSDDQTAPHEENEKNSLRVELPLSNQSMRRGHNSLHNKTWHYSTDGIQIHQMSRTEVVVQQNMDVHRRRKLDTLKLEYLQGFPKCFKNRLRIFRGFVAAVLHGG